MSVSSTNPTGDHYIVGFGASAGGLEAFSSILSLLDSDTDMSFILIQHLSPLKKSELRSIYTKRTDMEVVDVENDMEIKPNHVYISPSGQFVSVHEGKFKLEPFLDKVHPLTIDYFFKSIAASYHDQAIGVVLSGTGHDGTEGLISIKNVGGSTFAQEPSSSTFPDMPANAIKNASIDYILPPSEIAHELPLIKESRTGIHENNPDFLQIMNLLKVQYNVDFSLYKRATIYRRLQKQVQGTNSPSLKHYLDLIRNNPHELDALFRSLLIHVTSFFRDEEMYKTLEDTVIPKLLKGRTMNDSLRIWVPACSTGEEAYSIAICILEYFDSNSLDFPVQIFATDLNSNSISKARTGIYSTEDLKKVSMSRINKFFNKVSGGYQVSRRVRENIVFAQHDLISSPPFAHMDLISCRNILIYLNPEVQRNILMTLHYALKPKGVLILGASETVPTRFNLFSDLVDDGHIFIKKLGVDPIRFRYSPRTYLDTPIPVGEGLRTSRKTRAELLLEKADTLILTEHTLPGVIIDSEMNILQFRGDVDKYLKLSQGVANYNLLKMAKGPLSYKLRVGIEKVKRETKSVTEQNILLKENGKSHFVEFKIIPLNIPQESEPFFLIIFDESGRNSLSKQDKVESNLIKEFSESDLVKSLTSELEDVNKYLQYKIEELEQKNSEVMATHEELQASFEELQSTNEELETAKEELQASYEELTTLNEDYQNRNQELTTISNDLHNLINSTNLPILVVKDDYILRSISPKALEIFNLIESDLGRSILDINFNLRGANFDTLIKMSYENLEIINAEVTGDNDQLYAMQIRPYLTMDRRVEGVTIIFWDITSTLQLEREKEKINEELMKERIEAEKTREISRVKTNFMNTAAHEIRTPIASIRGFCELLFEGYGDGDEEKSKQALDVIMRNIDRLDVLSSDLLDMQRIESGKLRLEIRPCSLGELFQDIENELLPGIISKKQQLLLDYDDELELRIDPHRINQVLTNLINNASSYSPEETKIIVTVRKEDDLVRFSVQDQGIGLASENIPKLFLPFPGINIDNTTHGTGLGLSISKGLVLLHGGTLYAESEGPGKGSKFTFTIPLD